MRDVRPLRARPRSSTAGKTAPPETSESESPPASPARRRGAAAAATVPIELPAIGGHHPPGLDRSSAERLKRGRYKIEARIDLHGMTQDKAHRALADFIARAAQDERRCVLVITGKGLRKLGGEGGGRIHADDLGILRNAVPRWLNETPTRAYILAFGAAQPHDGGGGALYVLLRRRR